LDSLPKQIQIDSLRQGDSRRLSALSKYPL
jgi:hypothetical protein